MTYWKIESIKEEVAENVLADRNNYLQFITPEAKGRMLIKLCETFVWSLEELQEEAIIKILETIKTLEEMESVFKRTTYARKTTIKLGRKSVISALDGDETDKFEEWEKSIYPNELAYFLAIKDL